jgi:hypothetical protein
LGQFAYFVRVGVEAAPGAGPVSFTSMDEMDGAVGVNVGRTSDLESTPTPNPPTPQGRTQLEDLTKLINDGR